MPTTNSTYAVTLKSKSSDSYSQSEDEEHSLKDISFGALARAQDAYTLSRKRKRGSEPTLEEAKQNILRRRLEMQRTAVESEQQVENTRFEKARPTKEARPDPP